VLRETTEAGMRMKVICPAELQRLNVDTTVQTKAIRFPTDACLYHRVLERLLNRSGPFSYSSALVTLPNRPAEVQRMELSVIKIAPSLFAVSFSIDLTDEAPCKLDGSLTQHFLPEVVFRGLLPTRMDISNRSIVLSE
jgi:hypothetical protein